MKHPFHNVRETSAKVYAQIRDEGLLADQSFQVFESFCINGQMTARENDLHCGVGDRKLGRSLQPTIHHLVKIGVLRECGKRQCEVTKRLVTVYEVTGNLPTAVGEEKRPDRPTLVAALRQLEDVLAFWDLHHGHGDTPNELIKMARWLRQKLT